MVWAFGLRRLWGCELFILLYPPGSIRRQPNIILVAGSGFGGADDTLPYLTGTWSEKFDFPPMPFDGILCGSRVMVAKEGQANRAVKELIVQASGRDEH